MRAGWTWLRGGVLLTMLVVLSVGFLASRPPKPKMCIFWATTRVFVSTRTISAGETLGGGISVNVILESSVPGDVFVIGEDEDSSPDDYVLGITISQGEIIRRDWVTPKRTSLFERL